MRPEPSARRRRLQNSHIFLSYSSVGPSLEQVGGVRQAQRLGDAGLLGSDDRDRRRAASGLLPDLGHDVDIGQILLDGL